MPNKRQTRKGRNAGAAAAVHEQTIRQLKGRIDALERERKEKKELEIWSQRVDAAPLEFVYEDCVGAKSAWNLSQMLEADRDWLRKKELARELVSERSWRDVSNEKLPGHLDMFLKLSRYLLGFIMGRLREGVSRSMLYEWKCNTGHRKDPLNEQKISADRIRFLWAIQYGDVAGKPSFEELGRSLTFVNKEYGGMKHEERFNSLNNPEYLVSYDYNFEEGRKRLDEYFRLSLENFEQIIVELHNNPRYRA